MVIHNLTPVDNTLTRLHHATGDRDIPQHLLLYLLARTWLIGYILYQIIIDITILKQPLIQIRGTIIDDKLISALDHKEVTRILHTSHTVLQQMDIIIMLLLQTLIISSRDNSLIIQLRQRLLNITLI